MNILMLSIDAVRYDEFNKENFPNVFKLMKESGHLNFKKCYATSCWSPLSLASLFTGLYPSEHGVYGDNIDDLIYGKGKFGENLHLPENINFYPEQLSKMHYATACFSGGEFLTRERGFGRDLEGFYEFYTYFEDNLSFKEKIFRIKNGFDCKLFHACNLLKKWINSDWLNPFFVFFNIENTHHTYNAPKPFGTRQPFYIKGNTINEAYLYMAERLTLNKQDLENLKHKYREELRYADYRVGQIFKFLKKKRMLDDTLIVIMSDHGESFTEHGLLCHQFGLFEHLIHTPLVMIHPELKSKNVNNLISHIDVFPIILSMVKGKLKIPDNEFVIAEYGRPKGSLNILKRVAPEVDVAKFDRAIRSIVTKNSQYIEYQDGESFGDKKLKKKLRDWIINVKIPESLKI